MDTRLLFLLLAITIRPPTLRRTVPPHLVVVLTAVELRVTVILDIRDSLVIRIINSRDLR